MQAARFYLGRFQHCWQYLGPLGNQLPSPLFHREKLSPREVPTYLGMPTTWQENWAETPHPKC